MSHLQTALNEVPFGQSNWSVPKFLQNAATTLREWGGLFLILVGTIGVILAVYNVVTGMMSGGKKQTNYVSNVILLIISGALVFGGAQLTFRIAEGGLDTINELGS